jgi:hypothetical protein
MTVAEEDNMIRPKRILAKMVKELTQLGRDQYPISIPKKE